MNIVYIFTHLWTNQIVLTKEKIDKQTIHKAGLNLKSRENLEFCFCRKMWRTPKLGILNDHPVQGRDAVLPRTMDTPRKFGPMR